MQPTGSASGLTHGVLSSPQIKGCVTLVIPSIRQLSICTHPGSAAALPWGPQERLEAPSPSKPTAASSRSPTLNLHARHLPLWLKSLTRCFKVNIPRSVNKKCSSVTVLLHHFLKVGLGGKGWAVMSQADPCNLVLLGLEHTPGSSHWPAADRGLPAGRDSSQCPWGLSGAASTHWGLTFLHWGQFLGPLPHHSTYTTWWAQLACFRGSSS